METAKPFHKRPGLGWLRQAWVAGALLMLPLGGSGLQPAPAALRPVLTWTMINVNNGILNGDAHLLEMPDGSRLMIDVGDSGQGAVAFLKERGITRLDAVVISHPHKDHYGARETSCSTRPARGSKRFTPSMV